MSDETKGVRGLPPALACVRLHHAGARVVGEVTDRIVRDVIMPALEQKGP